ncbi:MAG: lipoate--protein ligase family protein [Oligoflexia bacterium]|nr:lipoate--protein ligase family protein [Oligoflexia bacterium]
MIFHISKSTDPYKNMVLEDYLLREVDSSHEGNDSSSGSSISSILFWRNIDSVVIGRFQNPWMECDLAAMERENILLVRRQSGGGTVYHDLGNLNFSIICSKNSFNKSSNLEIIKSALNKNFKLDIEISPRDDLLLQGKKISGSAFRFLKNKVLHHGTLLIDSDLNKLRKALNSSLASKIVESKSVASTPSKVVNICECLCLQNDCNNSVDVITDIMNAIKTQYINRSEIIWSEQSMLNNIPEFNSKVGKFKSHDWIIAETPFFKYEHRYTDNKSCRLDVLKGKIKKMEFISGDLKQVYEFLA